MHNAQCTLQNADMIPEQSDTQHGCCQRKLLRINVDRISEAI
jgi:hypothetical protein